MVLYLSHESALRYWLTKRGGEAMPDASDTRSLYRATASASEISHAGLPMEYSEENPLHLVVSSRQDVRSLKGVKTHVWSGPIVPGSFHELWGSSLVSSPEFTFLQMASHHALWENVRLGCYLCGQFSIDEKGGYAGLRTPLMTLESLADYLSALPGCYGVNQARRALPYISACAASPIEVLLATAFAMPVRYGGWGMPSIVLNQKIGVDERMYAIANTEFYVGDICLPSVKGDVEFDSYEYHTGKYRLDHTQERRNVLEVMGVKTMSATWGQINSFTKFETFVWMVKERFGIRQRDFTPAERRSQIELYENLANPEVRLF